MPRHGWVCYPSLMHSVLAVTGKRQPLLRPRYISNWNLAKTLAIKEWSVVRQLDVKLPLPKKKVVHSVNKKL